MTRIFLYFVLRILLCGFNNPLTVVVIGSTCGFICVVNIWFGFIDYMQGNLDLKRIIVVGLTGLIFYLSEKLLFESAKTHPRRRE